MSQYQADDLALAYHEAGHALVRWRFGWDIEKLAILGHGRAHTTGAPSLLQNLPLYKNLSAFRDEIAKHEDCSHLASEFDRIRDELREALETDDIAKNVMMLFAGPIAQKLGTGNCEFEETVDFVEIEGLVRQFLEYFRPSLDALAKELLEHKELDGDKAQAILREASR